ncbi:hypothetical protein HMPREF1423_00828 [Helicobacter pylori GAM270ASi]|nr:hypothetical protein HMPREF1423_00828 [Helicobacter pylori GAM270ASi]
MLKIAHNKRLKAIKKEGLPFFLKFIPKSSQKQKKSQSQTAKTP